MKEVIKKLRIVSTLHFQLHFVGNQFNAAAHQAALTLLHHNTKALYQDKYNPCMSFS